MFFSKNLRYLRKSKNGGQSQEKLAEVLGVTRSAIMTYESNRAEPFCKTYTNLNICCLLPASLSLLTPQGLDALETPQADAVELTAQFFRLSAALKSRPVWKPQPWHLNIRSFNVKSSDKVSGFSRS